MLTSKDKLDILVHALKKAAENAFALKAQKLALAALEPAIPAPVKALHSDPIGVHYLQYCEVRLPGYLGYVLFPRTDEGPQYGYIGPLLTNLHRDGLLTAPVEPVLEALDELAQSLEAACRVNDIDGILYTIQRARSLEELYETLPEIAQFLPSPSPEDTLPATTLERVDMLLAKFVSMSGE